MVRAGPSGAHPAVAEGGRSSLVPILFPLWFALSWHLFHSLFRRWGIPWLHRGEEFFFSAAAGLGGMSLAAMALGLAGFAGTVPFSVAAAATGAAGLALRSGRSSGQRPPAIPAPRAYAPCLASILLLPLIFLPPFFYDTLHYHYGLPSIFLRSGTTAPLPHVVESHFPLGVEMLYLIGMGDGGYVGANLVNFVLPALCAFGILCLADRLEARRAGIAALLLFLFSSTAAHTVFFQKNDLGVTLFFFSFSYSFLAYLSAGGDRRFLALSAAFAALALGAKYTMPALVFPVALTGFAARWRTLEEDRAGDAGKEIAPLAPVGRDIALFLGVCAAVYAIWPLRNLVATGNPVYPILAELFRSPGWSPAQSDLLSGDAHPLRTMLHSVRDVWVLLGSVTFFPRPDVTGVGASLGAGVVGAVAFLFRRRLSPPWTFLRNATAACLIGWFLTSWFSRFLLPALPVMALLAGKILDDLGRKAGGRGGILVGALVAVALAAQVSAFPDRTPIFRAWWGSLSLPGRPDRAASLASRIVPTLPAAQYVNGRLPGSARLLFVGETMTYYYRCDFVAPSAFDVHPLQGIAIPGKDSEEVRRELRRMRYTHVLVNRPEWERIGNSYYRDLWPKEDRMAVNRFLAGQPVVYSDANVVIHELEAPSRDAGRPIAPGDGREETRGGEAARR